MAYIDENNKYTDPLAYDERGNSNLLESYIASLWQPFLRKKIAENSENKIIADLGCGTCEYTQYAKKAKHIYAVDISKEMLDFGKNKMKDSKNISFIQGSSLETPIKDKEIDLVISFGVLEYVSPDLQIKEIERILKTGGKAFFLIPNKYNLHHLALACYRKIFSKEGKKELTIFQLRKIFKKYRFKITSLSSFGMIFYTRGRIYKYAIWAWKFLDFIYSPFQKIFPLGCNIYIEAQKI